MSQQTKIGRFDSLKEDIDERPHYRRQFSNQSFDRNRTSNRFTTRNFQNGRRQDYSNRRDNNSDQNNSFRSYRNANGPKYSHGDRSTDENPQLEKDLFDSSLEVSAGINFENYDNIPVEVSGENVPSAIDFFDQVENIHPQLLYNIERSGFTKPTPVQKYSFPICVAKRDIMGCAQTGSGKTAAFLFPMIQMLLETGGGDVNAGNYCVDFMKRIFVPVGLILAPTRELAIQIHSQARKYLYRTGMRACVVYGGMESRLQFSELEAGVDILVATPGRLNDLLQRRRMSLENIRYLVLDEADRMLDMGFEPQLREIMSPEFRMPVAGDRQTMMFSATFPKEIQILARKYMSDYIFVAVGRVGSTVDSIDQRVEFTEQNNKEFAMLKHLENFTSEGGLVLIFVQRKKSADRIDYFLNQSGIQACSIHGDHDQKQREFSLSLFKQGVCRVLVATDVASRGLDIPNVTHVVNFDMPNTIDDYVHRIGRTGRCGNTGVAMTLVSSDDNRKVLKDLVDLLNESKAEVPNWLVSLASLKGDYKGQRRFGGRDVRMKERRFGGKGYRRRGGGQSRNNEWDSGSNWRNQGAGSFGGHF